VFDRCGRTASVRRTSAATCWRSTPSSTRRGSLYGNLYVGRFADVDDRGVDRCRPAFVKVLVDAPGPEVDRLLQIGHENLVGLRAVVVGTELGQPSCLVYEGVDDAVDLHQYLVLRRMRDDSGDVQLVPDWR